MGKKNWMEKLQTLDGAVQRYIPGTTTPVPDVHSTVIQTPSPSFNFIFGNGWGLPLGYSAILYGPPKSGKSVLAWMMAGQVHRDYPDGIVIKFNTEFRETGQLTPKMAEIYGIDMDRYIGIDANSPDLIYDQIEHKIDAWCKDGMPLKMVIIDSMNGVQGRRGMESDSILKTQIGDVALTNKEGLKRVLPVQRRHKFALVMTSHVAVEMDPIEQKRGNKYKMGASIGVQHHTEYAIFVEPNRNKEGRTDLRGNEFVDENRKDINDRSEKLAHKIRAVMKDSSMGPKGRMAEFTFSYDKGVINAHEEVYLLGVNRGVIQRPNNRTYVFGERQWVGEGAFLDALAKDPDMQEAILKELRRQDLAGEQAAFDAKSAAEWASEESP